MQTIFVLYADWRARVIPLLYGSACHTATVWQRVSYRYCMAARVISLLYESACHRYCMAARVIQLLYGSACHGYCLRARIIATEQHQSSMAGGGGRPDPEEDLKPAANRTGVPPEVFSNYSRLGEHLRMVGG